MVSIAQLRNPKFYLLIFLDIVFFVVSLFLAYLACHEIGFDADHFLRFAGVLTWVVPLKMLVFLLSGLYAGMWRFTSLRDLRRLAVACLFSTALIILLLFAFPRFQGLSRGVFFVDGILTFMLTGGLRIGIRYCYAGQGKNNNADRVTRSWRQKRVLIVGAGRAGEKILREIMENKALNYNVLGFIDDDPAKHGLSIHGVRVLGDVACLEQITATLDVEQIFIALPSADGDTTRRIVEACLKTGISHKILPGIGELIDGRVSTKMLRDINYEDLLGRKPIQLDKRGIRDYLDDRVVLVTGCGGSIGSELCRQIVKYQPAKLILLDAGELNLFKIQMELRHELYMSKFEPVLGQVQDSRLIDKVFEKFQPEVVFHAAAYKHVPMIETNPWQAVDNNIVGSRVVMDAAIRHNVGRFVLVSTDKAVRPTNVMGASKRVTELIMQCSQGNGTKFVAVRFGNVVGSSGSVIPFFRRQIAHGGPVTVTHPEVNRFFMTIPEAAQMILQAGMMGEGGEIFLLKMGTPVKIADMARNLIRLSGKEPDEDIKIIYTGLREGEKLYEELITEGEDILPTTHKNVMVLKSNGLSANTSCHEETRLNLYRQIDELMSLARSYDARAIKAKLKEIVPEYTPQNNDSVL
ncbi:MAG: polysaccharide biosynthesis protein [Syntrophaceae bacterium]|nr:polysaccharide biosynthesis protein [Syntrophaceae bacterium]